MPIRSGDRLGQLESLRGLMAWWVVVAHLLGHSTVTVGRGGLALAILASGNQAVDVFMILSGFVITHLIVSQKESYGVYLGRRILRIYPLFLVCVGASIALVPIQREALRAVAAYSPYLQTSLSRFEAGVSDPLLVLPIKALMLHGVVPESWFVNIAGSYLGPAWSISTEWQFYLVAPFLLALGSSRIIGPFGWAVGIIGGYLLSRKFDNVAFVGHFAHLFFIGSVGARAYQSISANVSEEHASRLRMSLSAAIIISVVAAQSLPLAIWFACLWSVLGERVGHQDWFGRVVSWALSRRFLRFLGKISYSTYLIHLMAIHGAIVICARSGVELRGWPFFWRLTALVFPATLVLSAASYEWIEKPFIQLGRRIFAADRAAR